MTRFLRRFLLMFFFSGLFFVFVPAHGQTQEPIENSYDRYIEDKAKILAQNIKDQIFPICQEIEGTLRIRVMIKTEVFNDLSEFPQAVDLFFSEWIRKIGLEKRGILLFAGILPDSAQGRINLRVGIGLKYLITREMGEKILNGVILPNNANNNDGRAFLDGVLTIKRMLMDEFKSEKQFQVYPTSSFNLSEFLWNSKEIVLAFLVGLLLCYFVFFIERCPRCNGTLRVSFEQLKEAGINTLGLRCKIYNCERCGFLRRKKEPIYPPGGMGLWMRLIGPRRNVKIATIHELPGETHESIDRQDKAK